VNLKEKVIVVTGAGDGIGREMVFQLLAKGAKVAAVDIHDDRLSETMRMAGTLSSNLSTHVVDVADKLAVDQLPQQVLYAHNKVDAIINNAGIIQPFIKIHDLTFPLIEKVMDVNFYGTLYMTKAFLPLLLQRPDAYIVNVSSMGGYIPVPGQSVYCASKAAVKMMTEGLYAELLTTSVKVAIVFPGAVGTNISSNSGVIINHDSSKDKSSSFKPMPVERAASIIISSMEKGKTRVFVGKDAVFMTLLYRLMPDYAIRFIAKKMAFLLN